MARSFLILLVSGCLPLAAQSTTPSPTPPAFFDCDSVRQCQQGGGGAWVFDGAQGSASWPYGAFAKLTVVYYDGRNITIHREDTPESSSYRGLDRSQLPGGLYVADYSGIITGNRISGFVRWPGNSGGHPWLAFIPEHSCTEPGECPESIDAIMHLGAVALQAKRFPEALFCYRIGAANGNADGQGIAGTMILTGKGTSSNPAEAFPLLKASVEKNSYFGMYGIAEMYAHGLGIAKDPAQAEFWRAQADGRKEELEAAARSNQMNAMNTAILAAIILGAAFADMDGGPTRMDDQQYFEQEMRKLNQARARVPRQPTLP